MEAPMGLTYDPQDNRLFVAESENARVLVFDLNGSITNGMPAAAVIGQPDFQSKIVSPTNPAAPRATAYDPGLKRLFVSDSGRNRILVYDLASGIPAAPVHVIGQPDFATSSIPNPPTMASLDGGNSGIALDSAGQRLFVSNSIRRVTIYHLSGGISDGMPASEVLGAPDFTYNGFPASTINRLSTPGGVLFEPSLKTLFVADTIGHRVVTFSDPGCGRLAICGKITAVENPTTPLANVLVQLRNDRGVIQASKRTNSSGDYVFEETDGVALTQSYFVVPVMGRTQSAFPLQTPAQAVDSAGAVADFQVRGWPATLLGRAPQGSVVLVSTFSYTAQNPPPLSPSTTRAFFATAVASLNGTAGVTVGPGSYYVSCWQTNSTDRPTASAVTFTRSPASGSTGPYTVSPSQTVAVSRL
jgi:hypothetical protein